MNKEIGGTVSVSLPQQYDTTFPDFLKNMLEP